MGRHKTPRPTDAELAILTVLWKTSGISIRQIVAELKKVKPTTYATTQTLVRIMEKKGLVRRGEERYPALYSPTASPEVARGTLLREFIDRVFGGSIKQLMLHALSSRKASRREMDQIQRLIDKMEE